MRLLLALLPALALAQTPPAATPAPTTTPVKKSASLTTDDEKTVYALGLVVSQNLAAFDLTPSEVEIVKRAISDATAGKPEIALQDWGPKIQPFMNARAPAAAEKRRLREVAEAEKQKGPGAAYLTMAAAVPGAVKTDSGLVYRELKAGTGGSPKVTDTVKVHYRGTLIDGTEFDSSYKRNEPTQFPLNGVIKCWTEGVQRMKVGGKSNLACPSDIAYGNAGHPPAIPPGATLVFEIELLDIVQPKVAPAK